MQGSGHTFSALKLSVAPAIPKCYLTVTFGRLDLTHSEHGQTSETKAKSVLDINI